MFHNDFTSGDTRNLFLTDITKHKKWEESVIIIIIIEITTMIKYNMITFML